MKKFFLKPSGKVSDGWVLASGVQTFKHFTTKEEGLSECRDIIEKAGGGSMTIMKRDGTFEEERTYPRTLDPKETQG